MAADSPRADNCLSLDALPERTIFFDGVCNFCDHSVQWLLANDPSGRFHYASLQGETAHRLLTQLSDFSADNDSIVYLDMSGPTPLVTRRSRAVFAILEGLDSWTRHWVFLRVLPTWLTDFAYNLFAASRYRLFGKLDHCRIPDPEVRDRFLP